MNQDHDKDDDLFRRMADQLRGHAEPYRQGAWEEFAAKSGIAGRAKRKAWPYWAAAAVLLVGVSVAVLVNRPADPVQGPYAASSDAVEAVSAKPESEPDELVQTERVPEASRELATTALPSTPAVQAGQAGAQSADLGVASQEVEKEWDVEGLLAQQDTASVHAVAVVAQAGEPDSPLVAQADATDQHATADEPVAVPADPVFRPLGEPPVSYASGNGKEADAAGEQDKRWDLALVLSPSMTSEKVNMGGGVALAYRISDKFSISSGVSLAEMGVGQYPAGGHNGGRYSDASSQFNSPQSGAMESDRLTAGYESLGNSYLTSVTSSLLAMDVPLDLRYHVSPRFYSSVGVSMFAILEERRTVHYTTTTVSQNLNGLHYSRHEFSEAAAQHPIADQRIGGFLNFSVGHRVPLSRRVSLSFEPYFKVPMGNLSQQDMNLNHGGLKIVTGF